MEITAKGAKRLIKSVARSIEQNRGKKTPTQIAETAIAAGLGFETYQAMLATLERQYQERKGELEAATGEGEVVGMVLATPTAGPQLKAMLVTEDDVVLEFDAVPLVNVYPFGGTVRGLFSGEVIPELNRELGAILQKQGVAGPVVEALRGGDPVEYVVKMDGVALRRYIEQRLPHLWQEISTNYNCTAGMLCPACGSEAHFIIDGDDWDDDGSFDAKTFDRNGITCCGDCDHQAPTCEFFGEVLIERKASIATAAAAKLKKLVRNEKELLAFLESHLGVAEELEEVLR